MTTPGSALEILFRRLRAEGFSLGPGEFADVVRAFDRGFGLGSRRALHRTLRALWARSPQEWSIFDRIFALCIGDPAERPMAGDDADSWSGTDPRNDESSDDSREPSDEDEPASSQTPLDRTPRPTEYAALTDEMLSARDLSRISERVARTVDANLAPEVAAELRATTAATEPLLVQFAAEHPAWPIRHRETVTALRQHTRRVTRSTDVVDVDATVSRVAEQGYFLEPEWSTEGRRQRLFIVVDRGRTLEPFAPIFDRLALAMDRAGAVIEIDRYSVRESPTRFRHEATGRSVSSSEFLAGAHRRDARIVVVSDAGASFEALDRDRLESWTGWLRTAIGQRARVGWWHPVPLDRLPTRVVEALRKSGATVRSLDRSGLGEVLVALAGSRPPRSPAVQRVARVESRAQVRRDGTSLADRRLDRWLARRPDGHELLVQQCAVPLLLGPELAFAIWSLFRDDVHGRSLGTSWTAVPELLLAPFCRAIGSGLYQLESETRQRLLARLLENGRLGPDRASEIAALAKESARPALEASKPGAWALARAQSWGADAFLSPEKLESEMELLLDQAERLPDERLSWLSDLIRETFAHRQDRDAGLLAARAHFLVKDRRRSLAASDTESQSESSQESALPPSAEARSAPVERLGVVRLRVVGPELAPIISEFLDRPSAEETTDAKRRVVSYRHRDERVEIHFEETRSIRDAYEPSFDLSISLGVVDVDPAEMRFEPVTWIANAFGRRGRSSTDWRVLPFVRQTTMDPRGLSVVVDSKDTPLLSSYRSEGVDHNEMLLNATDARWVHLRATSRDLARPRIDRLGQVTIRLIDALTERVAAWRVPAAGESDRPVTYLPPTPDHAPSSTELEHWMASGSEGSAGGLLLHGPDVERCLRAVLRLAHDSLSDVHHRIWLRRHDEASYDYDLRQACRELGRPVEPKQDVHGAQEQFLQLLERAPASLVIFDGLPSDPEPIHKIAGRAGWHRFVFVTQNHPGWTNVRSIRIGAENEPARWVLVMGSSKGEFDPDFQRVAREVASGLARGGFGLVTGDARGVDTFVSREFREALNESNQPVRGRVRRIARSTGTTRVEADLDEIEILRPPTPGSSDDDIGLAVADAVVLIGGQGFTGQFARAALQATADRPARPVIPLPFTGGDAERLFHSEVLPRVIEGSERSSRSHPWGCLLGPHLRLLERPGEHLGEDLITVLDLIFADESPAEIELTTTGIENAEPVAARQVHEGRIRAIAWSPTGDVIATAGDDRIIRISDGYTLEPLAVLPGHAAPVNDLAWSDWLYSCDEDGRVLRRTPRPPEALREDPEGGVRDWSEARLARLEPHSNPKIARRRIPSPVTRLALLPAGSSHPGLALSEDALAVATADGAILFEPFNTKGLDEHDRPRRSAIRQLAWIDLQRLGIVRDDRPNEVTTWDLGPSERESALYHGDSAITAMTRTSDHDLSFGLADGRVVIRAESARTTIRCHADTVIGLALADETPYFATLSKLEGVKVWHVANPEPIGSIAVEAPVPGGLAFNPSNPTAIAVVDHGGTALRLYRLRLADEASSTVGSAPA